MKFYRENNINPAASCLPMVAQIPIFISLYFVLRDFDKNILTHLTDQNLSLARDRAGHHGAGQRALVGLPAAGRSTRSARRVDAADVDDDGARRSAILLLALPLVFLFFILNFPAGLVIYWVTTNLWTTGQGIITRRLLPKAPAPPGPKRSSRTPPKAEPEAEPAAARSADATDAGSGGGAHRAQGQARRRRSSAAVTRRGRASASRRPARRSARRSGRRCASWRRCSPGLDKARGAVPGRLGGRARAAGRRLCAGAGGGASPPTPRAARSSTADESEAGGAAQRARRADRVGDRARRRVDVRGGRGRRRAPRERARPRRSLIGRHGQTIDAVQYLATAVVFRVRRCAQGRRSWMRPATATGGRRRSRRSLAGRARAGCGAGRAVELEPMTAAERKIVHQTLKDDPGGRDRQRRGRAEPARGRRAGA